MGEAASVFLGSVRENMATARNVIDLSKVCENASRIGLSLCLLTQCTLCLAQGLEPIKYL